MTAAGKLIDLCKANAAKAAVNDNILADCVIGIGSGSTISYVVEHIKKVCHDKKLLVSCIPTSYQAKQLLYDYGLPVAELDGNPMIDVTIDGADEVDDNFVAIKGGGACLAQEKVVAFAAKKFVVVADYRKQSKRLGDNWTKGIPIEVLPMASQTVRHYISNKLQVDLNDLTVRIAKEKAGPVITDNGNFVIDWRLDQAKWGHFTSTDWLSWSNQVKLIPGVVETGIFAEMITEAYFGKDDGTVVKRVRPSNGHSNNIGDE